MARPVSNTEVIGYALLGCGVGTIMNFGFNRWAVLTALLGAVLSWIIAPDLRDRRSN